MKLFVIYASLTVLLLFTHTNAMAQKTKVTGTMMGHPQSFDQAVYNESNLQIKAGWDIFEKGGLSIFLEIEKGIIPEEQELVFEYPHPKGIRGLTAMYVHPNEERTQNFSTYNKEKNEPYKGVLKLTFGKEKDGQLPGSIEMNFPDNNTHIKGNFSAEMKGFRLIDGKPDLHSYSALTLEYLAKEYINEHFKRPVKSLKRKYSRMPLDEKMDYYGAKTGAFQEANLDVLVRFEGLLKNQLLRFLFKKGDEGWEVGQVLEPEKFPSGYTLDEKINKKPTTPMLIVRKMEKALQKEMPGRYGYVVNGPTFPRNTDPNTGLGESKVQVNLYKKDISDWGQESYFFYIQVKKAGSGWIVSKFLRKEETTW